MGASALAEAPETTLAETPLDGPRANGWTGGQYSLFRAFVGALLVGLFVYLVVRFSKAGSFEWVGAATAGILLSLLFHIRAGTTR